MNLRPELRFPVLDEDQVIQLADLAGSLDECDPRCDDCQGMLDRFNREAGTELPLEYFQGVSGGMSYETFVRGILAERAVRKIPDATHDELLEVVTRVCKGG